MEALNKLGIDFYGVIVYLVNFGIIMVVLTKYLYRPLMSFLDQRRETVRKSIEETEALKNAFAEQLAEKEQERERAVRDLRTELAEAKAFAEKKAKAALAEVDAERSRIIDETRSQMEQMKKDLVHKAETDIVSRMKEVVLHVVKDGSDEAAVAKSVERAWDRVKEQEGV